MSKTHSGKPVGIVSQATLSTIGLAVQGLARFLYTVFIGRTMGTEVLADASTLLSISVWMALVFPSGLGTAASRFFPTDEFAGAAAKQLNKYFWVVSPTLAIISIPFAFFLVKDLGAALSTGLLVFAYNAYVYTRGAMMGEGKVPRATLGDLISSVVAITVLLLVLFFEWNWALLLPLSLGFGIFALISKPTVVKTVVTPAQRIVFNKFLRDTVIGSLAVGGLLPTTMVFVRAFDSPSQAGLFAAALSLATPANMVAQAINQVLIPYFARMSATPNLIMSAQRRMFLASTGLFTLIFGTLILLTPFILDLLYGEDFLPAADMMRALLVVVFLISTTSSPSAYLFAVGKQRFYAYSWLVSLIAGTILMIILSPLYGAWGALIGYGVSSSIGSVAVILFGNFKK